LRVAGHRSQKQSRSSPRTRQPSTSTTILLSRGTAVPAKHPVPEPPHRFLDEMPRCRGECECQRQVKCRENRTRPDVDIDESEHLSDAFRKKIVVEVDPVADATRIHDRTSSKQSPGRTVESRISLSYQPDGQRHRRRVP